MKKYVKILRESNTIKTEEVLVLIVLETMEEELVITSLRQPVSDIQDSQELWLGQTLSTILFLFFFLIEYIPTRGIGK
jgi:hypothetical protein